MIPMKTAIEPSNGDKLNKFVYEKFQDAELSNTDLVSLIITSCNLAMGQISELHIFR